MAATIANATKYAARRERGQCYHDAQPVEKGLEYCQVVTREKQNCRPSEALQPHTLGRLVVKLGWY